MVQSRLEQAYSLRGGQQHRPRGRTKVRKRLRRRAQALTCLHSMLTRDMVHRVILWPVVKAHLVTQAKLHQAIGGTLWILKAYSDALPQDTEQHHGVATGKGAQQAQALLSIWEYTPHLHCQISTFGWQEPGLGLQDSTAAPRPSLRERKVLT